MIGIDEKTRALVHLSPRASLEAAAARTRGRERAMSPALKQALKTNAADYQRREDREARAAGAVDPLSPREEWVRLLAAHDELDAKQKALEGRQEAAPVRTW